MQSIAEAVMQQAERLRKEEIGRSEKTLKRIEDIAKMQQKELIHA